MINKIFFALLALATAVTAALAWYGYSWLLSIGDPQAAYDGFAYYQALEWTVLWPSALILLIVGNIILWNTKRGWALWVAFAYFAAFIIIHYFWVGRAGFEFRRAIDPAAGRFEFSILLGVVFVVLGAVIVYFNQYLVLRLVERMEPPASGKNESDEPAENV